MEGYLVTSVMWTTLRALSLFRNERDLIFVLIHYSLRVSGLTGVGDLLKLLMFQGLAKGQANSWMSETAFLFLTSRQWTRDLLSLMFRIEKRGYFRLITNHSSHEHFKNMSDGQFNKPLLHSLALSLGTLLKHRCKTEIMNAKQHRLLINQKGIRGFVSVLQELL